MKKIIMLLTFTVYVVAINAQDIIVKSTGDTIFCNIKNVTGKEIVYQANYDTYKIMLNQVRMYHQKGGFYHYIDNGVEMEYTRKPSEKFDTIPFSSDTIESEGSVIKNDELRKYFNDTTVPRTEEYAELLGVQRFLSLKAVVYVDYGQSPWHDSKLKDRHGNKIIFNSMIDALNYMNGLGWEFVNAYPITTGNQNVYHYLMKRRVQSKK